jgi:hypothetical protein
MNPGGNILRILQQPDEQHIADAGKLPAAIVRNN